MEEIITITVNLPQTKLPIETASVLSETGIDWTLTDSNETPIEPSDLLRTKCSDQNVLRLADSLEAAGFATRWRSRSRSRSCNRLVDSDQDDSINTKSYRPPPPDRPTDCPTDCPTDWPTEPTVLAVVPHWKCERWLARCLQSLANQTHPLTNIVVIDDGSKVPPLEIVKAFEQVTLLTSRLSQQVGPYRLVQSVISKVDYTAFLFQDADDWSGCDRLQTLLTTARTHSADIVGSQEIRVLEPEQSIQAVGYPINVNSAMACAPGHGLLHPTSLITQTILQKVGGFATGLRFGADSEFLLRAHWIARVVNSPRYCYFRRKRPESLTTAKETGLASPARIKLTHKIKQKALERAQAVKRGDMPNLEPLTVDPAVELKHLWGPRLRWR